MSYGFRSHARQRALLVPLTTAMLSMGGASSALAAERIAPLTPPVTIDYVLPTVANNNGANGTSWRTRVWIFNADSRTAAVRGYFGQSIPDLQDRPAWLAQVPPGRTVAFDDDEIGISGPGMLSFDVDESSVTDARRIVIRSETFNDAGLDDDGVPRRYGLGMVAQKVPQAYAPGGSLLQADEEALAPLPISPGPASMADASRVNAVFVSTTTGGTFSVVLKTPDGAVMTDAVGAECRRTVALPPFTWHQENDVFSWMNATPVPNSYLSVRPTMSDAFAAVIHVDNATGDGALFAATSERTLGSGFVFPIAHAGGANGTVWRTDVSIINPGRLPDARSLTMYYTERSTLFTLGYAVHPVPALGNVAFEDATVTMFPGNDALIRGQSTAGTVHGTFENGPSIITTLTYNDSPAGRFGVGIPAWSVEAAFGGDARVPAVIAGIEESASTRTNLTVRNIGPAYATITMTGIDADGRSLGTGSFVFAGYEERQYPSVLLETFGLSPPATNASVVLEYVPSGAQGPNVGRFIAFATPINNSTGDSTYLPAQALPPESAPKLRAP